MTRRPAIRCKAKRTSDSEPCQRWAMLGQEVCATHGGRAPQAKAAAARRQVEAKATAALSRENIQPVDNPLLALQQLAGEVVRVKDFLGGRVEVLQELRYRGIGGEQVRGELTAYGAAMDRSIRVLEAIARLNIDERLVKIAEADGRMIIAVMDASADVFMPGGSQNQLVREVIKRVIDAAVAANGKRFQVPALPDPLQAQLDDITRRWELADTVQQLEATIARQQADLLRLRARPGGQLAITAAPHDASVSVDEAVAMAQAARLEAEVERRVDDELMRRTGARMQPRIVEVSS